MSVKKLYVVDDGMVEAVSHAEYLEYARRNAMLSRLVGKPVVLGGFTIQRVKRGTPGYYEISGLPAASPDSKNKPRGMKFRRAISECDLANADLDSMLPPESA